MIRARLNCFMSFGRVLLKPGQLNPLWQPAPGANDFYSSFAGSGCTLGFGKT